ncbi:MAG: hypothetical protein H0W12_07925 [Chitinophagaceae bacterium]|nr:hypothetical protein [Chitinophagaceae bacterium]
MPTTNYHISFLKNAEIDKDKWDICVNDAPNGLIYGYSYYLDAMSKHWDGLVLDDYEAVMPLTWNRKFSIYYLYQPFLCASLGLFGKNLSDTLLTSFLEKIPARFKYWDIYLNHGNLFSLPGYEAYRRKNYVLNLNQPYDHLYNNYRSSYKQLIKKSASNNLAIKKNIAVESIVQLAGKKMQPLSNVSAKDLQNFVKLYYLLSAKKLAINYGVYLNEKLIASGIFLFSDKRAYYILAGNEKEFRITGASHLVIDAFIRDYADKEMILDFEGSNIEKIAFFFKGFGAHIEEYPGIKYNRLPGPVRFFKK